MLCPFQSPWFFADAALDCVDDGYHPYRQRQELAGVSGCLCGIDVVGIPRLDSVSAVVQEATGEALAHPLPDRQLELFSCLIAI